MSVKFARGKLAFGFCDRCYFRYPLSDLTFQIINQLPSGLKVCPTCNDEDHPQLQLGKFPINDPVALRDPRPDINKGRGLFGWDPVGNNATRVSVSIGTVNVVPFSAEGYATWYNSSGQIINWTNFSGNIVPWSGS